MSLDVHFYDGKLSQSINELNDILSSVKNDTRESKIMQAKNLEQELNKTPVFTQQARQNFLSILSQSNQNYDPTNGIDALDLLCLCDRIVGNKKDDDVLLIISTQLEEMSSGMCPQGRTHRLLQAILSLKEYL